MYGVLLQDWTTIRGNTSVISIVQTASGWLDVSDYEDLILWLQVQEVNVGGATNVVMNYQTSPSREDLLFVNMVAGVNMAAATAPTLSAVILSQNPAVPPAGWLRWSLSLSGTPTSTWDVTFRLFVACNCVS